MAESKSSSKADSPPKAVASNRGTNVILLLRDPQYMKEFLQTPSNYRKAENFYIYKLVIGEGLVFAEGDKWKAHRKIISSCFNFDFIKNKTHLIRETTREFLDKVSPAEYKDYLVMQRLQEITGEVVGRIFFGRNLNKYTFEEKPLTLALADLMIQLGELFFSPLHMLLGKKIVLLPLPKLRRLENKIKLFRAECNKIIEDRRKENQRYDDLLDALLAQQQGGEQNVDKKITDDDIINEFITFFVAGMDTTGHLAAMVLYNLTQHPQYISKLKEERDATYNASKNLDADTIQNMNLLNCVIKETLRHHTPAGVIFAREAQEDIKLGDIEIKKGTLVRPDPFAAAFDRKHFENPEEFSPERWQNTNMKIDPFAFIPFSAGPRNCIGQHLAMQEAKIIISEFLERFDFELKEGYKLRMTFRFVYEPFEELKFNLKKK